MTWKCNCPQATRDIAPYSSQLPSCTRDCIFTVLHKLMMATLLLFVLISPLAFFFSACAYRLWVHPLAAHPGPFWARITDLYHAYHSWKGDLHLDMWRCHQKYGDYVRYGPNCLMYNNAESLQGEGATSLLVRSPFVHLTYCLRFVLLR